MEQVRDYNANMTSQPRVISLFELGEDARTMQENWKKMQSKDKVIFLKEFPSINVCQIVEGCNGKDILEICLEIQLLIQHNNKLIAKERQARGIQMAREKGVKLGRRPIAIPKDFMHSYKQWQNREITCTMMTKKFNVDYKTLKKWMAELEAKEGMTE